MTQSYRLTRVEEIDQEHPGFEVWVKDRLAKENRTPFAELARLAREEFVCNRHSPKVCQIEIAERSLANYWERRFNREQTALSEAYLEAYGKGQALLQMFRQNPNLDRDELVQMLVTSGILTNQARLAEADPLKLLAEQRKRIELEQHAQEIEIDRGKLETEKGKLELQIEKSRQAVEETTHEAAKQIGEGRSATLEDINHIRERTFGLPPIERKPSAGPAT